MLPIGNKNYQKSYQKMQSIDEKTSGNVLEPQMGSYHSTVSLQKHLISNSLY